MARPAYDQTSLLNCKECNTPLDKSKLKGNRCMACHSKETARRKKAKRHAVVEAHGNKCHDCNQTFPEVCYDFHHTDPAGKDTAVATLINYGRKLETIMEEASKCVMLCANCHRLRHFT